MGLWARGWFACAVGGVVACGGAQETPAKRAASDAQAAPAIDDGGPAADYDAGLADTPQDGGPSRQSDGAVPFADDAGGDVAVARRPFPIVPNTAGFVLAAPKLVTIVAANDALASTLNAFSDAVPSSAAWTQVSAEYGLGALTSAAHLTGPALSGTLTTGQIANFIATAIASEPGLAPNGRTIYLVYLPDGASYEGSPFSGYHVPYPNAATSTGDQIATVMRFPPVLGGETELGRLTRVASHEIVESATDPLEEGYNLGATPLTAPWTASIWQSYEIEGDVELGDLCEGTREFEAQDGAPDGGWEYQRFWSNAAAAEASGSPCVPAPAGGYFSVTVPEDWYAVPAGTTLSIPFGGWSEGSPSNWLVKLDLDYAGGTGALAGLADGGGVITSAIGPEPAPGCLPRAAVNDGTQGAVEITMPPGTPSGQYAVFLLASFHETATCTPPLSEDEIHYWPFGVYTP